MAPVGPELPAASTGQELSCVFSATKQGIGLPNATPRCHPEVSAKAVHNEWWPSKRPTDRPARNL